MTVWAMANIIIGLITILAIMGIAFHLFKQYTQKSNAKRSSAPMEVMYRLALSQRQGLAIVRIEDRQFAVSIGEGGVQFLTEIESKKTPSEPVLPPKRSISRVSAPRTTIPAKRLSYIAPMEDFRAVLSMSMNGSTRS